MRHAPEVVLSIAPRAAGAPAASTAAPRLSPVMREYLDTRDLRSFYDRLLSAPSRTGEEDFILAQMMEMCGYLAKQFPGDLLASDEARGRFVASISPKDPDREKRIAAYDRAASRRCVGFEDVRASMKEVRAVLARAAAAGDPKATAQLIEREVFAPFRIDVKDRTPNRLPKITDAQLAGLQQAARSGDPAAIVIAGRVLSSTLGNLVVQAGEGAQAIDPQAFHDAWSLAACDFGLPCGAEHRTVVNACITRGNCGAGSLREHMFYYQHSPRQSQLINDYHAHLVGAIRTGDWSWFNFHRGAPTGGSVFFFGHAGP